MLNNAHEHLQQIVKKERIAYLDISNRDLAGNGDLSEFTNLKSLNASNNKFTSLDFLLSLPNKDKLTSLNLFGNEISAVDFAILFNNFPKLKVINFDNNPLSLINFEQLSVAQVAGLVAAVANKKIKISSWKGTLTLDLLSIIQQLKRQLAATDDNQPNSAHNQQVRNEQISKQKPAPTNNFGGIIAVIGGSLLIGSLFAFIFLKSKKKPLKYE